MLVVRIWHFQKEHGLEICAPNPAIGAISGSNIQVAIIVLCHSQIHLSVQMKFSIHIKDENVGKLFHTSQFHSVFEVRNKCDV